jgi:hypothetical protein
LVFGPIALEVDRVERGVQADPVALVVKAAKAEREAPERAALVRLEMGGRVGRAATADKAGRAGKAVPEAQAVVGIILR